MSDANTIVENIWLLHARAAKESHVKAAKTICRALGADTGLCNEIEQHCARLQSTEEGRVYQNFVIDQGPAKETRSGAPFWFQYMTDAEKKAHAPTEANNNMVLDEIDIYKTCKDQLQSVNRFAERDWIVFADRIKDV